MVKQLDRLYAEERKKLTDLICGDPVLTGRTYCRIGTALNRVNHHLNQLGFHLDMVSGDNFLGQGGSLSLPFRRSHEDVFSEHPQVNNAFIYFSWECMNRPQPGGVRDMSKIEVVAYVS